jgi:putative Mn2+ efflux pump MntP
VAVVHAGGVLKLLAFVLPLGLDSFAVAAAIGASAPVTGWQRLRITLVFVVFETGMPLVGLGLGSSLARGAGTVAGYLAAAAVTGVGGWMLAGRGDDASQRAGGRLAGAGVLGMIALGVSISMDELAIGFGIGLVRLPLLAALVAIGVQTLVVAQLGLRLGNRISERLRERAERLAGLALVLLGGFLLAEQLAR